tara:strand:+ start:1758 stop:1919 length:162 start_codon:yes stop_codon:yes gene_type:complete
MNSQILDADDVAEDLADLLVETGAVPSRYRAIILDEAEKILPDYLSLIAQLRV